MASGDRRVSRPGLPGRNGNPDRSQAFDFNHFVALSGEEGRKWVEEYQQPRCQQVVLATKQALVELRTWDVASGRALLDGARSALGSTCEASPSVMFVLQRWYYGVLAFFQYCIEDFGAAGESLSRAQEAITSAIGSRRFLLPLANHCYEFRLHHARIARNRQRWSEMWSHVEQARGMADGRLPLCSLADGTPVALSTLAAYYCSLEAALSEEEKEFLAGEIDPEQRLWRFDLYVQTVCNLPGFVIPYP
jgi:hypothetical protein